MNFHQQTITTQSKILAAVTKKLQNRLKEGGKSIIQFGWIRTYTYFISLQSKGCKIRAKIHMFITVFSRIRNYPVKVSRARVAFPKYCISQRLELATRFQLTILKG